jgi:hypothetical protein
MSNTNQTPNQTQRTARDIIEAARVEMMNRQRANQEAINNAFQEMVIRLGMVGASGSDVRMPSIDGTASADSPHRAYAHADETRAGNTTATSSPTSAAPAAGPNIVNGIHAANPGTEVTDQNHMTNGATLARDKLALIPYEGPKSESGEASKSDGACTPRSTMSAPPVLPNEVRESAHDSEFDHAEPTNTRHGPYRRQWSDQGYLLAYPDFMEGPRLFETEEPDNADELFRWESWILRRLIKSILSRVTDATIAQKLNAEWYRAFLRRDEADRIAREAEMMREAEGPERQGSDGRDAGCGRN